MGTTRTVVVLAGLARAARTDLRAHTDPLADLELGHVLADLDDLADDLVARDDEFGLPRAPAARDGVVVLASARLTLHFRRETGEEL